MEIGEKLKEKRSQLHLSQEQLAAQLGVTRQTIASWEKGKTYPDIGSILKLSDLYGVSLDELLKEDAHMKQHVEKTAALAGSLWNSLFVTAVLLLPASMLLNHWNWASAGVAVKLVSLVLLLVVLVFRWRLSGRKRRDLVIGIFFCAVFFLTDMLRWIAPQDALVPGFTFEYILFGIVLIYGYGHWFQTKLAYLLTIGIFFCTPVYIAASTYMPVILEQGITASETVFGKQYYVEDVIYQEQGVAVPAGVALGSDGMTLLLDGTETGQFEKVSTDSGSSYMEWKLIPKGEPAGRMRLSGTKPFDGHLMLEYRIEEAEKSRLIWSIRLCAVENIWLKLKQENNEISSLMLWNSGENVPEGEALFAITSVEGEAKASIVVKDETVTEVTLVEEYHWSDGTERRECRLTRDETGEFLLPEVLCNRHGTEGEYVVYRVLWDKGVYSLRINLI